MEELEQTDFSGVIENIQQHKTEIEKQKEIAAQVYKILEMPEWKLIEAQIEELKKDFIRKPEDYFHNPGLAGIDYGARSVLTLLTDWLERQKTIINSI